MIRRASNTAIFLGAIALLAGAACDRARTPGEATTPGRRVLLIARGPDDPVWRIARRLKDASRPLSPGVGFDERLPAGDAPEEQQRALATAAAQKYDAICVWVNDPDALRGPIADLTARGLPLVLLGSDVPDSNRAMYCGPDDEEIGTELARACVAALSGPARTIGLMHASTAEPGETTRVAAFRRQLAAAGGIDILREVDYGARELEARQVLSDEVARYPRMGGWVLMNDWPLAGAPADPALVPTGATLVFYTSTASALSKLRQVEKSAAVCPDFARMFRRGMWAAAELAKRTKLQTEIDTIPPLIVTRENLDELERAWYGETATQGSKP